jgi:phosphoserine aminotransferase
MAMWCLLGPRPVDIFAWESFGQGWVTDITRQLKLENVNVYDAPYGELPDLRSANAEHDAIFTWNGTTSGVRVANGDWIDADRQGLVLCDATSAVFAMPIDWHKLDVVTWSWQKVLGGEAAHGMLALSPKAVARLESWEPIWPLPKLFRLTKSGKLDREIFAGSTINTPSMLAVEDQLDALSWADRIGGLPELIARSSRNLDTVSQWVAQTPWIEFLAADAAIRSSTSICLAIVDPWFTDQSEASQRDIIKRMVTLLDQENVARDIEGYRDAPPGLRIWGGATVESDDIQKLTPWLNWAWDTIRSSEHE